MEIQALALGIKKHCVHVHSLRLDLIPPPVIAVRPVQIRAAEVLDTLVHGYRITVLQYRFS